MNSDYLPIPLLKIEFVATGNFRYRMVYRNLGRPFQSDFPDKTAIGHSVPSKLELNLLGRAPLYGIPNIEVAVLLPLH